MLREGLGEKCLAINILVESLSSGLYENNFEALGQKRRSFFYSNWAKTAICYSNYAFDVGNNNRREPDGSRHDGRHIEDTS